MTSDASLPPESTGTEPRVAPGESGEQPFGAGLTPLDSSPAESSSSGDGGEDSPRPRKKTRTSKKKRATRSRRRKSPEPPTEADSGAKAEPPEVEAEAPSDAGAPEEKPAPRKKRRRRSAASRRSESTEAVETPAEPEAAGSESTDTGESAGEAGERETAEDSTRPAARKTRKRPARRSRKPAVEPADPDSDPPANEEADSEAASGEAEKPARTTRTRRGKKKPRRRSEKVEDFLMEPGDEAGGEGAGEEPDPTGADPGGREESPEVEADGEAGKGKGRRSRSSRGSRGRSSREIEPAPVARDKKILIDCMDPEELRIAVLEDDVLQELYFDRTEDKKYLGNIYKGRIVNLEPAIQAAFVELGIGRNGFLHVSDVLPIYAGATSIPVDDLSRRPRDRKKLRIQDILQKGQEVLVQISKDSIGAKGPSLTTYVSIPGKNLVLMPGVSRFGVSKKIQDRGLRSRLRESLSRLDPPKGLGFIIRTAGKDISHEAFEKDLDTLKDTWEEIREKVLKDGSPRLLRRESDLITRAMRDVCGTEVSEVVVSDEQTYHKVKEVLREIMPHAEERVKQYRGTLPLFSKFKVEEEIDKIYNRRIPLPSGGSLIVEQTEALVSIDVNSGKYTDEEDLEETALKINLEAAEEVARQLRLRDLGGVIVNDFIDMVQEENRRTVEQAFRKALRRDRAKCWVSKISRFGIIEMTRQRVRPSLERTIYEPCKHCNGTGMNKSTRTIATSILRQLRVGVATRKKPSVEVFTHPRVQSYLLNDRRRQILELEESSRKSIIIHGDAGRHPEDFAIKYI